MLDSIARKEAAMTEQANDRFEGYCDGIAGRWQATRSDEYNEARQDGAFDRAMLAMHYEFKRRAALTPASA
jgi:hypothetical protein